MLVSNGEFLEFITDKGYENREYWDEEGQAWIEQLGRKIPVYWKEEDGRYLLKTMNRWMPLPLDWPAEVNNL